MWIIAQPELHALITEAAKHVDANAFSRDARNVQRGGRPTPNTMHNYLKGRMLATLVDLHRKASVLFATRPGVTISGVALRFIAGPMESASAEVRAHILRTYVEVIPYLFQDPKHVILAKGLVTDCLDGGRSSVAVADSIYTKMVARDRQREDAVAAASAA